MIDILLWIAEGYRVTHLRGVMWLKFSALHTSSRASLQLAALPVTIAAAFSGPIFLIWDFAHSTFYQVNSMQEPQVYCRKEEVQRKCSSRS